MATPKIANLTAAVITAFALGACAQGSPMSSQASTSTGTGGAPAQPERAFNRFPDIPVPTGAQMDVKRTLVFGGGETWIGQVGIDTNHDTDSMFDFYKQELPGFGWQEITSVRAMVSVLTYERQGRVLSIQLEKGTIMGAKITLTVSPKGDAAGGGAMGGAVVPAMN